MKITLPEDVKKITAELNANGFEAFIVGGCVRDSVMGIAPKDWDITTNAEPEQVKKVLFGAFTIKDYAQKYASITAVGKNDTFEITTYRLDGKYTDNRRPDSVKFAGSLKEDLSRRDFTVNAMAYSEACGLVDPFCGLTDIKNKVIRCVGEPSLRFREDALRILRAMRFSSELGFTVEKNTFDAMLEQRMLLKTISAQRAASELLKTLCGKDVARALAENAELIFTLIPELALSKDFPQNSPYHNLGIWEHTIKSVEACKNTPILRLTMLLHDIAKPSCFTMDEYGIGHFRGHTALGSTMAEQILTRLKFPANTIKTVSKLIWHHDEKLFYNSARLTKPALKKLLCEIGSDSFLMLLEIKKADSMAKSELGRISALENVRSAKKLFDEIISRDECFDQSKLKINGDDLKELGVSGQDIGKILKECLSAVINEEIQNEKASLIEFAAGLCYTRN